MPSEQGGSSTKRFPYPSSRTPLKSLRPGIIIGAADDDHSGIAAYSQAGANFGLAVNGIREQRLIRTKVYLE
jgi:hypothetical protein